MHHKIYVKTCLFNYLLVEKKTETKHVMCCVHQKKMQHNKLSKLQVCLLVPHCLCYFSVGGEKVLLLSAAAWGSMTAFTPILAHLCSQPIVSMTVARFLMGLLQGEELAEGDERCK